MAEDQVIFEPQQSEPVWKGKLVSASYLDTLHSRLAAVEQQLADCVKSHQRTNVLLEEALDERDRALRELELNAGALTDANNAASAALQQRDEARTEVARLREVLMAIATIARTGEGEPEDLEAIQVTLIDAGLDRLGLADSGGEPSGEA